jgi:hypothetical protein
MTPSSGSATVTAERRRHHRLSSRLDTALSVCLVMANGTEHLAEVVDLSASGIRLRWPAERMAVVDVGQEVELHVQPCTVNEPLAVHAAVRWRDPDDSGKVRYGLEFQERADLPGEVAATLCRLFGRRHGPQ